MYIDSVDEYVSFIRALISVEHIEQGRFSATAGTHNGDHSSTFFGDVNVAKTDPAIIEFVFQSLGFEADPWFIDRCRKPFLDKVEIDRIAFFLTEGRSGRPDPAHSRKHDLSVQIRFRLSDETDKIAFDRRQFENDYEAFHFRNFPVVAFG